MENDNLGFPPDRERLEYIERTVREHSAQEVDIERIVIKAMDAYWGPRIKEAIPNHDLDQVRLKGTNLNDLALNDLELTTAILLRRAAYFFERRAEKLNQLLAVLIPSLVYVVIVFILVSQRGDWGTPISNMVVFLAVSLPVALAIALVTVSRQAQKPLGLGVRTNKAAWFMTRVPTGAACGGLILAALTTWTVIYVVDGYRERSTIKFYSAKNSLVDNSVSTMKTLQAFPHTKIEKKTTEVPVSPTDVFSLRSEPATSKSDRGGKVFIEDKGAFPGQLRADIDPGSATVFWKEEGKSEVAQTKIYVCTVKDISGDKVIVEAMSTNGSASSDNKDQSKSGSAPQNSLDSSGSESIRTISLEINGNSIELTLNPESMSAQQFSKGQSLILAYDAKTHVASRIEPIYISAALRVRTPETGQMSAR